MIVSCACLVLQASRVWVQNKVDESKHEIHSQVDAITAGTASVVNLTAGKTLRGLVCCGFVYLKKKKQKNASSLIETDFHTMRQQSIFRHPECFRHFLPLTQEKCGEHLIPLCLCHVSSLKSTYAALLIVRQCAGRTSKYAEVSFSLLGAYSPNDETRRVCRLLARPAVVFPGAADSPPRTVK